MPKDMPADVRVEAIAGKPVELPSGHFLANADMSRAGMDLHITGPGGHSIVVEGYFAQQVPPDLVTHDGARLTPAMVNAFVPPEHAGQYASSGQIVNDASPAGKITHVIGDAHIIHADGTKTVAHDGSLIYQGDVVETAKSGAVNMQFSDNTTFAISDNARMSVDQYVYHAADHSGSTFFSMLQGVFVYTSGLIGKTDTGAVNIETPVGSIGIRGTVIAAHILPAGQHSQITIVDGAITLTNGTGTQELNSHLETISVNGYQSQPELVAMSDSTFNSEYQSMSSMVGSELNHFTGMGTSAPADHAAAISALVAENIPSAPTSTGSNFSDGSGSTNAGSTSSNSNTGSSNSIEVNGADHTIAGSVVIPHDLLPPATLTSTQLIDGHEILTITGGGSTSVPITLAANGSEIEYTINGTLHGPTSLTNSTLYNLDLPLSSNESYSITVNELGSHSQTIGTISFTVVTTDATVINTPDNSSSLYSGTAVYADISSTIGSQTLYSNNTDTPGDILIGNSSGENIVYLENTVFTLVDGGSETGSGSENNQLNLLNITNLDLTSTTGTIENINVVNLNSNSIKLDIKDIFEMTPTTDHTLTITAASGTGNVAAVLSDSNGILVQNAVYTVTHPGDVEYTGLYQTHKVTLIIEGAGTPSISGTTANVSVTHHA